MDIADGLKLSPGSPWGQERCDLHQLCTIPALELLTGGWLTCLGDHHRAATAETRIELWGCLLSSPSPLWKLSSSFMIPVPPLEVFCSQHWDPHPLFSLPIESFPKSHSQHSPKPHRNILTEVSEAIWEHAAKWAKSTGGLKEYIFH